MLDQLFATFMHRQAVYMKGPPLQTDVQLGEEVSVWIGFQKAPGEQPQVIALPGVCVGVHLLSTMAALDVAFQIGDTDVFGVVRNVSSPVTKRGEQYNPFLQQTNDPDGGDGKGPQEPEKAKRPGLKLAADNTNRPLDKDSQLRSDEAAVDRAEAAPPALAVVRMSGYDLDVNKRLDTAEELSGGAGLLVTEGGQRLMRGAAEHAQEIALKQTQLRNKVLEIAGGLEGKRVLEFAMDREIWVEMTSAMPEGALIIFEDAHTFEIEYPTVLAADTEIQRFFAKFPLRVDDVDVLLKP